MSLTGQSVRVTIADEEVWDRLRAAVPEFSAEMVEHLSDNFGEVLNHLLFADLVRFMLAARVRGDDALVTRIFDFADLVIREGDDAARNVVEVSFVENVVGGVPSDDDWAFVASWPIALRKDADRYR
jgi:hypothetical protein